MISPTIHLIAKQCHRRWQLSLYRSVTVFKQRQLSISEGKERTFSKNNDFDNVRKINVNSVKTNTFTKKAQKAVKDTVYSFVVVAGVVALGGLCYLMLHEFYSRETPNGIYKEASNMCLENIDVQEALGKPITVHTTPKIGSLRINNVRAKVFDEKGHQSMTVSFYLTGQHRSGVVGVKVQKNISNKYVYDYILVQLDRSWQNQNIIQVYRNFEHRSVNAKSLSENVDF